MAQERQRDFGGEPAVDDAFDALVWQLRSPEDENEYEDDAACGRALCIEQSPVPVGGPRWMETV